MEEKKDYQDAYKKEHYKAVYLANRVAELEDQVDDLQFKLNRIKNNPIWKASGPARKCMHFVIRQKDRLKNCGSLSGVIAKVRYKSWEKKAMTHYGTQSFPSAEERQKQEAAVFERMPKISILVPLWNTPESFLTEMIGSVQWQTYKNWELCLADGSDDAHAYVGEYCKRLVAQDSRIVYQKLAKNEGISGNTNECYKLASGEFIGLFDHDDILHPLSLIHIFSDLRENIVGWLPVDKSMKVLEIGSGCGAITGSLAQKAGSVTCVDLSKKRSLINAYRHQDCDNVTIHVGNFSDIEPDLPTDYDFVCLIGVFEYGQSYIGGKTPFHDFYRIIKKHVKSDGHIVIAIENKLGLKYWAGCREDHVGTFFSGLEDYPQGGAARTFSRSGLEKILKECGETEYHFYYPYPDYKFMTTLYSDRYLPKVGELSNNLRNFDRDRMLLFDEKKVFDMLIREGLFGQYSNSFLVMTGPMTDIVYSRFSNDRAEHLSIRTDILEKDGKHTVRKYPATSAAAAHIEALAENECVFTERFKGSTLSVNRLELKRNPDGLPFAEIEYLENSRTLEELLDECLQNNDEAGFDKPVSYTHLDVYKRQSQEQLRSSRTVFL